MPAQRSDLGRADGDDSRGGEHSGTFRRSVVARDGGGRAFGIRAHRRLDRPDVARVPERRGRRGDQVVVGYSIFSPQAYPSAGYSVRTAGGCDGQLARIHTLAAGLSVCVKPDSSGLNRWGDLSETVVDPQDDLSIWTIQEYAAAPIQGASRWGTWWGGFSPAESGREDACIAPAPEQTPAALRTRISSGPR